jgi:hypothetical protein
MASIGKLEAERIDRFVAEGMRLIGLPNDTAAPLSSVPQLVPSASKPTENAPPLKMTIGNAIR